MFFQQNYIRSTSDSAQLRTEKEKKMSKKPKKKVKINKLY